MARFEVTEQGEIRPNSRRLIGRLVLLEVVLLFLALLVAMALLGGARGPMPRLADNAFLISTVLIVLSSGLLVIARLKRRASTRFWQLMALNWLLGLAFLVTQLVGFWAIFQALQKTDLASQVQMLYVVAGVHAVHVLGGMVLLTRVTRRAVFGVYHPDRDDSFGLLEPYWHLLSGIWILFYLIL